MKKQILLFASLFVCCITNIYSQTTKVFQAPTTQSNPACYDFDKIITCGNDNNCHHAGKDYCGAESDEIVAAGSGRVVYIDNGDNRGLGKTVVIAHKTTSGDIYTMYSHLSSISALVSNGMYLTKGFKIGNKGLSGSGSNGIVHLHFEIKNHSGLGHNPNCDGSGCVGYVKSTLLPVSSRGYMNPNSYINIQSYKDISLKTVLPLSITKGTNNILLTVNSPFVSNCNVDIRLSLYSTNNQYLGDIQSYTNKVITPGDNAIMFSKPALSSNVGMYKLQLDYKSVGASVWKAVPTENTTNPQNVNLTL